MSLFGTLIKQAAKASDSLFDDVAVQAKKVDEVWDEEAWIAANPRPHPGIAKKDMTPDQAKEYSAWINKKYREKNRNKIRERDAQRYRDNAKDPEYREAQNERMRKYRRDNPEYVESTAKRKSERYRNDPEHRESVLERSRERYQDIKDTPEYKGRNARTVARHKAARLERTPAWSDPDRIDEIYRTAAEISSMTGIPHHVDHVIPLNGRRVSGLHHQDNLLIVPGVENMSKGNRFDPGDLPPRAGIRNARAYLKKIREAKERAKR